MKKQLLTLLLGAASCTTSMGSVVIDNGTYRWSGDSIVQGEFYAVAPSSREIRSTYHAQPRFFMPIAQQWTLKNDISSYPQLETPSRLHEAIYNMGLDEMVNAVEPDTTLRTGKEWAGVWTRDVSYSILLSMAYMQPEASMISLSKKITPHGRIVQDTGSGGAWPVSTDRQIWCVAAFEVYKVTGSREWLNKIYPVVKNSLLDDLANGIYDENTSLARGETSFIDWREQSHPKWMQCADIYSSQTLSTSLVHAQAWKCLAEMATILGDKPMAEQASAQSIAIANGVNEHLWMEDKGYYAMYRYGRQHLILNPRAETLGESLAIMWDFASTQRARAISENNPTTPFGAAIFYPQIKDMPAYHNNALWPWVGAYWALANAKAGNEAGTLEAMGAIFRPAALFCTNKENFNLDNGDIATELNSSNMLWCLSGNIALTHKILFGIDFQTNGLAFHPMVPKAIAGEMKLTNFKYRNAVLNISLSGSGNVIKSFKVNGKEQKPYIDALKAKGVLNVEITLASTDVPTLKVNHQENAKAPLTPIAWLEGNTLCWNPIEYIHHYIVVRNGKRIATVYSTTFDASTPGEYQVIGVDSNGVEGFASQPCSTQKTIIADLGERTTLNSAEVAYEPRQAIAGYQGKGFVETDKKTGKIAVKMSVPEDGIYHLTLRYANGNGPVNTENRCCVRTVNIDGSAIGIVVMPHRGVANWSEWGYSNVLSTSLTAGEHNIEIEYLPHNENMNIATNHAIIDYIKLTKE